MFMGVTVVCNPAHGMQQRDIFLHLIRTMKLNISVEKLFGLILSHTPVHI